MEVALGVDRRPSSEVIPEVAASFSAEDVVSFARAAPVTLPKDIQNAPPVAQAVRVADEVWVVERSSESIDNLVASHGGKESADPSPRGIDFDPLYRVASTTPFAANKVPKGVKNDVSGRRCSIQH